MCVCVFERKKGALGKLNVCFGNMFHMPQLHNFWNNILCHHCCIVACVLKYKVSMSIFYNL